MFIRFFILSIITLCVLPANASTEIIWNGFASFYGRKSVSKGTYEESLVPGSINAEDSTKLGLNMRSDFRKDMALVAQLVVAHRNEFSSRPPKWSPDFDWFFVSYDSTDTTNVQIGRQLLPGSLSGEYIDVGLTYPWREIPPAIAMADRFKSFEGISFTYRTQFGDGNLRLKAYGGESHDDAPTVGEVGLEVDDLVGTMAVYENNGFRVLASYGQYRVAVMIPNFAYNPQNPASKPYFSSEIGELNKRLIAGASYDRGGLLTYAEYLEIRDDAFDGRFIEGYYGTLGYRLGKFLPHYTYGFADWDIPAQIQGTEVSHSIAVNYQFDPSVVIKTEFTRQRDTDGTLTLNKQDNWADSVAVGMDIVF
jgi:hypothetical protein